MARADDFFRKYNGKRIDYDGVDAYQCVDIIKQYLDEWFGIKAGAWGNAKDYWLSTNPAVLAKFDKIVTSQTQSDDIVVFKPTSYNPYGHIGIGVDSRLIEQNGGTGSGTGTGTDAIRVRTMPGGIYGVLRPKQQLNGGSDLITKEDVYNIRIINSEVEGYPFSETHAGKFDAQELAAWVGQPWSKFIQQKWKQGEKFRNERNSLKARVAELEAQVKATYEPVSEQLYRKK